VVRIRFSLSAETDVTVDIFDVTNKRVKTLLANEFRSAGEQFIPWDGKNGRNRRVANGVYFYRISTRNGLNAYGKIVVLD
jgi:flagellar hook assembly protein FlgD